jgi:hypothetical protein
MRPKRVDGLNEGHGHVFPRADGVRMRCGGPKSSLGCISCKADVKLKSEQDREISAEFDEELPIGTREHNNQANNTAAQPTIPVQGVKLNAALRLLKTED